MTTGIETWAGNVADIGPMYPFVGTELILFIICFAYWIYWHIAQMRQEMAVYEHDVKNIGNKETLTDLVVNEHTFMEKGAPQA